MKTEKTKSGKITMYALLAAAAVLGVVLLAWGGVLDNKSAAASATDAYNMSDAEKYARDTEARIKELCERIKGADDVSVAVTLKGSYTAVYARQGGKDVLVEYRMPEISGIGIVCRGGGNPEIQKEITSLVSAWVGVGTNKIYVCEAQS